MDRLNWLFVVTMAALLLFLFLYGVYLSMRLGAMVS